MIAEVKKMTLVDLTACLAVFRGDSLEAHYGEQVLEWVTTGIEQHELWGAVSKTGEVVGVMWVEQQGFFHAYPYLAVIGVRQDAQGQGIGKLLLACYEAMGRALGYDKITLMVGDFNLRAKKLYEAVGYLEVGRAPKVYRPNIDEFIMVKELN